jgi:hypothetical protein
VIGFAPGTYHLIVSITGRTGESRGRAIVPFSILDKNIEISAPITPGVDVDGVLLAAEGAKLPDPTKATIYLRAADSVGGNQPVSPAPDGKFRIEHVQLADQMVLISGLGPGNYVKEIRYNGVKVGADVVTLESGDATRTLTIVIDDKPGAITGAVMSGDKPVSRPLVMARKWPRSDGSSRFGSANARGDDAGRFRLGGLAPGEYRVIALHSVDPLTSNAALEAAFSAAKNIEIGPNGLLTLTLEVTDLR